MTKLPYHVASEETAVVAASEEEESWVPKINMVFENDEKAYQFYCHYAKQMGFGVRKHLVKRRSNGLVYCRVFSCYKEGFSRSLKEGKQQLLNGRTGCEAHMTVKISGDGRFHVSEFSPQHNHELVSDSSFAVVNVSNNSGISPKDGSRLTTSEAIVWPSLRNFAQMKPMNVEKVEGLVSVMRYVQQRAHVGSAHHPSSTGRETNSCICDAPDDNGVPKIGMQFEDDEECYQFYVNYGTSIGFSVRKHLVKRRASGVIYLRTYVCHKEGFRRKKDEQRWRCPKPYDRTGCLASMTIKIIKNGKYRVTEFEPKHNHALVIPSKAHLFRWRWRKGILVSKAELMELADQLVQTTEPGNKQLDKQIENHEDTTTRAVACRNYIQSKRMSSVHIGDVGAMLQYLHGKQAADPSFYYALQMDCDDQVTNIFWTDAKSIVDFAYFGDVLCFDISFKLSDYGRPFTQFIGINHHRQVIIFGAAMLYDETEESFKWLFQTFHDAMYEKQPNVILTGRSIAIRNAVAAVWPGTIHRLCVWHIFNDAMKHLNFVFEGSTTFRKDFSRCLYDFEDEDDFLLEWRTLLDNYDLHGNEWLENLYEDRENWALPYGRQTFCADMATILVSENMNSKLKQHLDPQINLLDFFKHYEEIVDERCHVELQSDIYVHQSVKKMPTSRMLRQAATAYTPAVFKIFRREFELSMDCMVYSCGQVGRTFEYKVVVEDKPKEYVVKFDSSSSAVSCSCRKFEFEGIQCRHVLKTLDVINIKELPLQYILKRWTKDAKVAKIRDHERIGVNADNRSTFSGRYKSLCHIFNNIAVRAAEDAQAYAFIESLSDHFMDQIHQIPQTRLPEDHDAANILYLS